MPQIQMFRQYISDPVQQSCMDSEILSAIHELLREGNAKLDSVQDFIGAVSKFYSNDEICVLAPAFYSIYHQWLVYVINQCDRLIELYRIEESALKRMEESSIPGNTVVIEKKKIIHEFYNELRLKSLNELASIQNDFFSTN